LKSFVNFDLGALNVLTIPVDRKVVAEFESLSRGPFRDDDYAILNPKWNSDLQWISANTLDSFAIFQSAFDRLGIAEHVRQHLDLEHEPRLYAGFLLLRSSCSDTNFHVDWIDTGNQAFTFITPLDEHSRDFGIIYRKLTGTIGEYGYKPGEGIMFGDNFCHSTKPGLSEEPVRLLCFQFGTDKMEYWDKILATAGYQSLLIQQPDGQFAVREGSSWTVQPQPRP
jgi:hypothetical protein